MEDKRSQVEEEPTAEEEGTGKGTGTGGTGIGLRTTVAVAAGDSGGIGGGDPTWAASVVALVAVSCNAEAVDTRPCGSTFYFSCMLFFFSLVLYYYWEGWPRSRRVCTLHFALCRSQPRE